jgi:phosphoserine aminotransferase
MLFDVIDGSKGYYVNKTDKRFRSRMNVIMRIAGSNAELEKKLQAEAEKVKIVNIAGHWLNPGIRMSLYNAMPIEGVIHLCNFL